jgi:hypothetical protein
MTCLCPRQPSKGSRDRIVLLSERPIRPTRLPCCPSAGSAAVGPLQLIERVVRDHEGPGWRLCLRGSPQCPGRVCPAQVGRGRNESRCVLAAKPRWTVQRCRPPDLEGLRDPLELHPWTAILVGAMIPPAEMKGVSRMRQRPT